MIVVVDTNVIVSGLNPGATPPPYILRAWLNEVFFLAMSKETHAELLGVLRRGYWIRRLAPMQPFVASVKVKIKRDALFYADLPSGPFPVTDPKDEKFLAVAEAARADYLVSGDNHLRTLGTFMGTAILTPRQFVDMLETAGENDKDDLFSDSFEW